VKLRLKKGSAGRALSRRWLPLIAICTVVIIAVAIQTVRNSSHSISYPPTTTTIAPTVVQINPKNITYELFGSLGNGGKVVYANLNSQPIEVALTSLPWSHSETTMASAATLSLVAQIDGGALGCRILVGSHVRDEHYVSHDSAAITCLVSAA